MPPALLVPIGVLVAALAFLVLRSRTVRTRAGVPPPVPRPLPADVEQDVRRALGAGQKIAAIKLLRDRTGAGLAEAKAAVEALATGRPATLAARPDVSAELAGELRSLLHADRKIEAIRLFRERTGAGLKEAKDAVEALEA